MNSEIRKNVLFEQTFKTTPAAQWDIICLIKKIVRRYNLVPSLPDYELTLVIDEAVTNAMEHGNKWDCQKAVTVSVWIERKTLHLSIEDEGKGFDFVKFSNECAKGSTLTRRGKGLIIINHFCSPTWKNSGKVIELVIDLKNDVVIA